MLSQPDISEAQIPVIDISDANAAASQQLLEAAYRNGFVFIANNGSGVPPDLIADLFDLARQFFALPLDVKESVSISSNRAGKNHGWLSQGVEKLDPATQKKPDVKEAFNMGEPVNDNFEQSLPSLLQQKKQILLRFQSACHGLCQRILRHFAVALEISPEWFTSRHDRSKGPSGTVFRMLYYPQATDKEDRGVDIRAGAHSDYGSITCLFQLPGQPGLEILTPDGQWAAVPVDPESQASTATKASEVPDHSTVKPLPILVNIGDLLEDWTGGLLKSTKHRVVFPKEDAGDRYSLAYFCHPLDEALLESVPSKLVEEHIRAKGREGGSAVARQDGGTITARDHLMQRLAATYTIKS